MSFEGIYTAYMTGVAGSGLGMFVFKEGQISGADLSGLTFSGKYSVEGELVSGIIHYEMPANSVSITGAEFQRPSGVISVPFELPIEIDPEKTYRINTPIGPINTKFKKSIGFDER
ncbi:hypothetical protein [Celeribacter sp.]|uniref:hypothetical protein n=1 Tax=Celeribacter sp. TaxID=1890673 RepID=UPI003A93E20C